MQNQKVQLNLSSQEQDDDQFAKQLFDQIQLSEEEQGNLQISNQQSIQQSIQMKDYKIKRTKKEKKKLKKFNKAKQRKQKNQISKMQIQSDAEQMLQQQQKDQQLGEYSQQYSNQQVNKSQQQVMANLNPHQSEQQTKKPKRLMQASKKWMKQKLIEKSSSKKQRIQQQEGFKLDELGNDGIIDQLNESVDEDDDSFSDQNNKGKKKGKNSKNKKQRKQKKQKLTNDQLMKKLGQIGCGQSQQDMDSQRYNVDSGIENVQKMKGKRQQKKSIKIQNKLFGDFNFNLQKQNGQMPPPPQQNLQLELKPKTSQYSVSSSFLARIQTIKKNRGLQANVDEAQFQKMNRQKNKRSITKLANKLNDEIQKDQDIDLMVRVPSFSRGKSADIINNTLYIKTYSQNNSKTQQKFNEAQDLKQNKFPSKNSKSKIISRNQFFKNMKNDVQLRRSKYISDEELINNIKKTGLEELQQVRKKIEQKRRKQAMIQSGQFDDADDFIQQLQDQLNQKGISKKQLKKLIEMEDGVQADIQQADQSQQDQKQELKPDQNKIQTEKTEKKCQEVLPQDKQYSLKAKSERYSQKGSKKSEGMDIQDQDLVQQFSEEDQNLMPENMNQQLEQKIVSESSSQEDQQEEESQMQNQNNQKQNQENPQGQRQKQEQANKKMAEQQQKRKKQLQELQQEGIGIKKRYILAQKSDKVIQRQNIAKLNSQQDQKQNADFNILEPNGIVNSKLNELKQKQINFSNKSIEQQQNHEQLQQPEQKFDQEQKIQAEQNLQHEQNFKEFKKLRKIATIIAQKRQKRQQELKRAKQFFQQQAELGSDNQDHDEIVKKINKKEEDDEYDGADLDQQLEELIDNAVDINEENQKEAFKKYMQQQKQKDREELQKILRGEFRRKQVDDIQLEEDEKNRNDRIQKMMEWIQKQQQDEAGLYAKQSSSEDQDSYFGYKNHKKHKKLEQSEESGQQNGEQQKEDKQDMNKKLQMYLEDSISPSKTKFQKFQMNMDLLNSIPESNIRQKQAISMNASKKTISNSTVQQFINSQPQKYAVNSLFGGLLNLTGPSKNQDKSNSTGLKLKKTHSHMNQYLKKTISQQSKKSNQGAKLPAIFHKAFAVKK